MAKTIGIDFTSTEKWNVEQYFSAYEYYLEVKQAEKENKV